MERETIYHSLKILEPAIAKRVLIPELGHIWFNGKVAIAGNDKGFGITVPCKLDGFTGGIQGSVLLGMLNASKAKDFVIKQEDNACVLVLGRSRVAISPLPMEKIMIEIPKEGKTVKLTPQFIGALGRTMLSAGSPIAAKPEQAGVTLIKKGELINVFSTDDVTMSWATCPVAQSPPIKDRVILPIQFVETLLDISKGHDTEMYMDDTGVYAKSEMASVFARVISTEDPTDLLGIGEEAISKAKYIPIPTRMKLALQRAEVILHKQKEDTVKIQVKAGNLTLRATSPLGNMKDTIETGVKHPDATCTVNPKFIKRAIGDVKNMYVSQNAFVMQGNDTVYLVSGK